MAEVKWIKIVTDIFDNRKIKLIRKMPEGDAIIVTWLQLLCLAGETNDNGLIYITRAMPYTEESLSNAFDTPLAVVRLALETFQGLEMIDIVDSFLCISNWEKYQNVDGLTRIREQTRKRVAAHREKQRALMSKNVCQYCGGRATGYDHIIPLARGGLDEDFNKVECCMECNRIKNDKPLIDFLNSNRDRINDALIASNSKLSNIVTLHNVTRRYIVTHCNATDIERDKEEDIEGDIKKERAPARHKHGEYGWVLLTDEQYARLIADLGQGEADRCILYVDESAQKTSNKNGWKDWNLVVRKCSREAWGAEKKWNNKTMPQISNEPPAKDELIALKEYLKKVKA